MPSLLLVAQHDAESSHGLPTIASQSRVTLLPRMTAAMRQSSATTAAAGDAFSEGRRATGREHLRYRRSIFKSSRAMVRERDAQKHY